MHEYYGRAGSRGVGSAAPSRRYRTVGPAPAAVPRLPALKSTSTMRRLLRITACTTKVMRPPAARQTARNSIGAIVLPVASRIQGTAFCAMKPPRLPTELIAARPAAAEAPVRKLDGRLHSTGCPAKIPAAAPHRNANFTASP